MGSLRLILALSVVAYHCGPIFGLQLVGGQVAVQSFFMISGFYMTLILKEKYIGSNSSYKLFITNRLLRLIPIYWIVLIAMVVTCVGIAIITHGQHFPRFENSYLVVKSNISSFIFLAFSNIFIFGQDLVMFMGIDPASGNLFFLNDLKNSPPPALYTFLMMPQGWTLELEILFYLIAPFLLKFRMRNLLIIIICSFALRLFIYNVIGFQKDPWSYRFFPTEIMFFLLGSIAYYFYGKIRHMKVPNWISYLTIFIVFGFTIVFPNLSMDKLSFMPFTWKESAYFLTILIAIPLLFNFFKSNKIDAWIGELSFPVYISHLFIFMICRNVKFINIDSAWIVALISILFSLLLNKLIAAPIEKFRQARLKKV